MYCQAPGVPLHVVEQACWEDEEDDGHKEAARQLKNRNDIIEKLLKENARLSNHMKKFKDTAHESGKQIKKLEKIKSLSASPHWISTNTLLEFLNNHYGGLTRYTIQSDEWHANNPNAAKELFGYPTWEATKQSIAEQFPSLVEKGPLETPPRIFQSKKGVLQLDDVSEFEKCLCVKLMDRTGLTKSRAALLMGRQDRTVTYWRQAWCPQWGISRDGLEQSKHKAHLNQATRKGPTAAQRKKKALASSAANEAKKRKTNNDSSNNMPTAAENDAMAFLPGGLPPSQLMQQHHDIPGLSQLTGLSAHHLGGMGGEEHQQQHSHLQQQQHQQPQPPPGLTLNFHPHQGFPGNFALQQPFQHYIQQAPIPPHHPQPQQQQQQQPGQQQQQQQPPGHHGQQQQQQLQDDAAAAMAAAAGVLPKNQRRGQNMYYGL